MLVGGCPAGSEVTLPARPLHYDELDLRGAFHHTPREVDRALALLAAGDVAWEPFAGDEVTLEGLAAALLAPASGAARKPVVRPR